MLTPMHVQYLVGLCCLRHTPEAVDITIGAMLADEASGTERDVDVAVTVRKDGQPIEVIAGYEVKNESKPLDVSKVEQLCVKLTDIPSLNHRAIVSASGYSDSAVHKAEHHGIELYEFARWNEPVRDTFVRTALEGPPSKSLLFSGIGLDWIKATACIVTAPPCQPGAGHAAIDATRPVFDQAGNPHPTYQHLDALVQAVRQDAATKLKNRPEIAAARLQPSKIPPSELADGYYGDAIPVDDIRIQIGEPVYVDSAGTLARIEEIRLFGEVQWKRERIQAEYHVMRQYRTSEVYAGAAVANVPGHEGVMWAVLLSPKSSRAMFTPIHLTATQRNAIRRLRIR